MIRKPARAAARNLWPALASVFAIVASGCAGVMIDPHARAHGNVLQYLEPHRPKRAAKPPASPLVVLVEDSHVRALNPVTAQIEWSVHLAVAGHPVGSAHTIYVPIRGHRLVALERATGQVRWTEPLPGEALSGIWVAEPWVLATVIDRRRGRTAIAGLSSTTGQLRWIRRADARLGTPAAVASVALVPLGDQVVALKLRSGRELARMDVPGRPGPARTPALERIVVQDGAVLAGQGTRWVDLRTVTAARTDALVTVQPGFADVFSEVAGLDPGVGDDERRRLWVGFPATGGAPRRAVLLCRRVVLALRLSPDGLAARSLWVHHVGDPREFVAMDVSGGRISLVREDGALVVLDAMTGRELDRVAGGKPVRGALLLDMPRTAASATKPPPAAAVRVDLLDLVSDPDPRLLPAQRLAAALLWRDADVSARELVVALGRGELRPESTAAAEQLRTYALDLVAGPWGALGEMEAERLRTELAARPSFLAEVRPPLAELARKAVRSGSPELVPHLVEHLLHPATPAADLGEVAAALSQIGSPQAIDGVAAFVRRYHADGDVLYESKALHHAVDFLAAAAVDGGDRAKIAAEVLDAVAHDPFTEPALRVYTAARLPAPTSASAPPDDPTAPEPPSLPDPRL